ncbi:hypothetical protein D3874_26955 [Oleomonas cavernae]|uniref:Uncharacterized protein n=1 Tax=Oleomonas cavernae TaxID=2320859 RepID=A0A418VU94_9PROT|nr:hypothetical protein [Oleomonas cavernae]RJF80731.1 hypothetical protein D3874_26955 [Oleomonas cavernae]
MLKFLDSVRDAIGIAILLAFCAAVSIIPAAGALGVVLVITDFPDDIQRAIRRCIVQVRASSFITEQEAYLITLCMENEGYRLRADAYPEYMRAIDFNVYRPDGVWESLIYDVKQAIKEKSFAPLTHE